MSVQSRSGLGQRSKITRDSGADEEAVMVNVVLIIGSAALVSGCSGVVPSQADLSARINTQLQCPDTGYDGFTFPKEFRIPDGDAAGIRIGPLHVIDDGHPVEDLMVGVTISHGYVGDVELRLVYDENGDGRYEASTTLEFYRARLDGCSEDELHAYPVELDGTYFFRSDHAQAANGDSPLNMFDGFRKCGDFYLTVADSGAGNAGVVKSWTLYLRNVRHGVETGWATSD